MMTKLAPQPSPDDEFSPRTIWNRIRTAADVTYASYVRFGR